MKYIATGFGLAFLIALTISVFSPFERDQRQVLAEASRLANTVHVSSRPQYHEVSTLSNGVKVGTEGALSYILDPYGDRMSGGYHSIRVEGAGYVATLGAKTYRLDSSGAVSPDSFGYDFGYEYQKE